MTSPRELPRLHLVTNDEVIGRAEFTGVAEELLSAGGARLALHLRARGASGRRMYELARRLVESARATASVLLVNDRLDVGMAVGADGVQVGSTGLATSDARRLLGPDRVLGVSVHSASAAEEARADGADFILAGTLFASASHPGRAGSGTEWLRQAGVEITPVIGIGGITLERVPEVLAAGAYGVAVIRAVWDAQRPREAVLRLVNALYERD